MNFEQFENNSNNQDLALALAFYSVGKQKFCAECYDPDTKGLKCKFATLEKKNPTCAGCDKTFAEILADLESDGDEISLSAIAKEFDIDEDGEDKKERKPRKVKAVSNISSKGFVDSMSIVETKARAYANLFVKKECNIEKIKDSKIVLPKEAKAIEQEVLTITEEDEIVLTKEDKEEMRNKRIAALPITDNVIDPKTMAMDIF